jgi:hypothetical protein
MVGANPIFSIIMYIRDRQSDQIGRNFAILKWIGLFIHIYPKLYYF